MTIHNREPEHVPLEAYKRTKIVATVGPSTNSYEHILHLIESGANGIRLNFSHGTQEERDRQVVWIRKAAKACNKPVAIIQDLQGPKIRLGDFDGVINVQHGQSLSFALNADYDETGIIPLQYDLSKKVKRGERLYIYDGKVRTTVTSVQDGTVYVRAENDGILIKRKGINVPDTNFDGDIITPKDKEDIAYGTTQDFDYVALSFIQTADDIKVLRRTLQGLGSSAKIIAKIETVSAVENIEEIVIASDMMMVARGDLAVETSPESVPIVQRKIIELGIKHTKPTIVATQMLASMTESPEPTRAEVSDVATAVFLGADAVMLSDETASGRYPLEAVQVMKRVITHTESHAPHTHTLAAHSKAIMSKQQAICDAIITLAEDIRAVGIIAETKSGTTALQIAAHRPSVPIIAVTSNARTAQQLTLVYGVKSYIQPDEHLQATKLTNWLLHQRILCKGDIVVTASGQHPGVVGTTDTIKIRVI